MQNDLIIISEYCNHCNIEPSFILMLGEDGLIDIEEIDNRSCFPAAQLRELERYATSIMTFPSTWKVLMPSPIC